MSQVNELRESVELAISKHEAIPISSWRETTDGTLVADDKKTAYRKWQSNFADDIMQLVSEAQIKARLVELDLLEQAINAGRDMNEFKMQRLEHLLKLLQEAGDVR